MKTIAMGIDIGGSHISCVAVDLPKQSIIEESRGSQTVDNQAPAGDILNRGPRRWVSRRRIDRTRLAGLGFAMPGPFDSRMALPGSPRMS